MSKIYRASIDFWTSEFEVRCGIEDTQEAEETCKQTVEFWTGHDRVLALFDGDYRKAFMSYLTTHLAGMDEQNRSTEGIRQRFDWEQRGGGVEGFPPLGGEQGITLLSCLPLAYDHEDVEVRVEV